VIFDFHFKIVTALPRSQSPAVACSSTVYRLSGKWWSNVTENKGKESERKGGKCEGRLGFCGIFSRQIEATSWLKWFKVY